MEPVTSNDAPEMATRRGEKARALVVRAQALVEALVERIKPTLLWRIWERMLENEFMERSIALATKGFISLFPLLVIIASISPPRIREAMFRSLTHRFGIQGETLDLVKGAFLSTSKVWDATGLLGLILVLYFATSFTSTLHRMYLKAWRLPRAKGKGNNRQLRGLAWLAAVVVFGAVFGGLRGWMTGPVGTASFFAMSLVGSLLLWWATAWLMLGGRIRWRVLLAPSALTAMGAVTYTLCAPIWMPRVIAAHVEQFGFFGVSLALVTWFVGFAFIIVVTTCVGPVLAEDNGLLGRLTLGDVPSPLTNADDPDQVLPLGSAA